MLNPTASFVGEGGSGVSTFFSLDRTRQAPQGLAGHHYFGFALSHGVRDGTDLWFYHTRVLGRYEDEHLQMTGFMVKQKIGPKSAGGILLQIGSQRGYGLFLGRRFPLLGGNGEKSSDRLQLHLGLMWANWKGEWSGEEWVPYAGISHEIDRRLRLTIEIRERQKDFLKPTWLLAAHYQLNARWLLVTGLHQSGLSDRAYPFLAIGSGVGIFGTR
ncbi:MAG: hypothetical protein NZ959_08230 [Armatimonadetes bacterium]|nr:hypothetical protein [Armatimonadota bacterium]MDW8122792.1 hypothetical protein [Armatimonadota bacterium]